jgi:hypothetical protein
MQLEANVSGNSNGQSHAKLNWRKRTVAHESLTQVTAWFYPKERHAEVIYWLVGELDFPGKVRRYAEYAAESRKRQESSGWLF